jgi:hypothetical protein
VKIRQCDVELRLKLRDATKLGIRLGTQRLNGLLQVGDYSAGNADGVRRASAALTARPAFTLCATVPAWPASACRRATNSL